MKKMLLAVLILILGVTAVSAQQWSNGSLARNGDFVWANGGGDPYRGSLEQALQLLGVTDARLRRIILREVRDHPNGNAESYRLRDGDRMGPMVSGNGWVAQNPVAQVSSWSPSRSRTVDVWYIYDAQTGHQYRLVRPRVCGNWSFTVVSGPPVYCRCDPVRDACHR